MRMLRVVCSVCLFTVCTILPSWGQEEAIPRERVATEDAIITTLYEVISGPAGEKRDWDLMRGLFQEDARLQAMARDQQGNPRLISMTVEGYIERNGPYLEENGFFEVELHRKTDRFGNIVQIFSTYASKRTEDGPVYQRGINSIQLIKMDDRYYITNILWNSEYEDTPIPAKYLN